MYVTEYEQLILSRSKVMSKKTRGFFLYIKNPLKHCIQYVSLSGIPLIVMESRKRACLQKSFHRGKPEEACRLVRFFPSADRHPGWPVAFI